VIMMNNDEKNRLKLVLALGYYEDLRPQEKCKLLNEYFNNQMSEFDVSFDWTERIRLSSHKRVRFNQFLKHFVLEEKLAELNDLGMGFVSILSGDYPLSLKNIYNPPLVIFYKGTYSLIHTHCLGIVGSRLSTEYGYGACSHLIPDLVKHHVTIVSGLAKGIDTKSHMEAINNNGPTIGVIGTGINIAYPKENKALQSEISRNHLLLSEYPPHTTPKKHHFPFRNRIIAGISSGVLVVEAKKRSGSLITARQALEEGRDVFCIPGSIFHPTSIGTNELIKEGAKLVTDAEDILEEWQHHILK